MKEVNFHLDGLIDIGANVNGPVNSGPLTPVVDVPELVIFFLVNVN